MVEARADVMRAAQTGALWRLADQDLMTTATEAVRRLAAKPAHALQASKRLMRRPFREEIKAAMEAENEEFSVRDGDDTILQLPKGQMLDLRTKSRWMLRIISSGSALRVHIHHRRASAGTLTQFPIEAFDLTSLQALAYSGSPMSPAVVRRAREVLPHVKLVQGYGLSETGFLTGLQDHEHAEDRLTSCGRPCPGGRRECLFRRRRSRYLRASCGSRSSSLRKT